MTHLPIINWLAAQNLARLPILLCQLSMNVSFGESDKNFDEYSTKAFLGKVNFSGIGIFHFFRERAHFASPLDIL